jgi:4-amino-4-deoxy-L-arabinose transferase-like glycosyltransferase
LKTGLFFRRNSLWLEWGLVVALTIGAFLLRRYNLGTQSLWFDEADLAARASADTGEILKNFLKAGENGPLYTLLLHFWIKLAGTGEMALRTPSLLAGTAAIPLIYMVGRKLTGSKVGLLAAFLLAISPYNIWYSQDAKMYPLAVTLTLASVWLFLKALESRRWLTWILYIIITTLSLYIHVMCALIVVVQVAYYFGRRFVTGEPLPEHSRKQVLVSLGLLTLPYLPLALWQFVALWDGTVGTTWFVPVSLPDMFNSLIRRFAVNRSLEPWESLGAYAFLVLVLLGLWAVWRNSKNRLQAFFLTLYLALPVLAFYFLTTRIPLFAERYLLIASPAYYLLAAGGIVWLANRRFTLPLAMVGLVLVTVTGGIALVNYNYSKEAQKEDWREAMKQLSREVRSGDVVLIMPGYLETAVNYYFKPAEGVAVRTVPHGIEIPEAVGDPADINLNDFLQKTIKGHERVWLVVSPERYRREDPREFIRTVWFDNNTQMFTDPQEFVGVKLYGYYFYLIPGTRAEFYPYTATNDYTFGDSLKLWGYDYRSSGAGPGVGLPDGTVKVGENLHLTLFFRKLLADNTDYEVTVRLVAKDGTDTATNYTAQPAGGYYPTSKWDKGESVRDYREIYIKVPPGEYRLEVSVHPAGKPGTPLPAKGSEGQNQLQDAAKIILALPVKVVS